MLGNEIEFVGDEFMEAYIYGAGSMGVNSIKVLLENGIKIKAVIDKNINLIGKKIGDIGIISLNDIPDGDKLNVIFAVAVNKFPFNEIKNSLESIGCKNVVYVGDLINSVYSGPSIANTWELKNVTEKEEEKLKFVYNNYNDENSKAAFRQATKWLKDRVELIENGAMCDFDSKYFIDKVCDVLKDEEIFVDCGAYDGVSIAKMIKYTNNRFDKIYAFEPNVENYSKLNEFIKERELENKVVVYNSGLGNLDGRKNFTSKLGLTSRYSDEYGDMYCKINKIDTIMNGISYTFLKIYGIGNGLDILEGGINTIKEFRPIVTFNIHHSRDNFVNMPYFLMTNLENYNFYLRLHGYVGSDITFYAIPKER